MTQYSNGDYLLLGTDGLWDHFKSTEIAEILKLNESKSVDEISKLIFDKLMHKVSEETRISVDIIMEIEPGDHKRNIHDDITYILLEL